MAEPGTPTLDETAAAAAGDDAARDRTSATDISYYQQSAFGRRLTLEAAKRAQRARREALALIPVAAAVVLLWVYREDIFGTDTPARVAAAVLLAAVGWRFARDIGRSLGPRLLARFDPATASTVSFLVQLVTLLVVIVVALRLMDVETRAIAVG